MFTSQTPTPPSQSTSGFGSGGPSASGSGSGSGGPYYLNESLSESSGDSLPGNTARVSRRSTNRIRTSKSASNVVTNCEVYSEVVDAAEAATTPGDTSVDSGVIDTPAAAGRSPFAKLR